VPASSCSSSFVGTSAVAITRALSLDGRLHGADVTGMGLFQRVDRRREGRAAMLLTIMSTTMLDIGPWLMAYRSAGAWWAQALHHTVRPASQLPGGCARSGGCPTSPPLPADARGSWARRFALANSFGVLLSIIRPSGNSILRGFRVERCPARGRVAQCRPTLTRRAWRTGRPESHRH
jgi:hypothetical protein